MNLNQDVSMEVEYLESVEVGFVEVAMVVVLVSVGRRVHVPEYTRDPHVYPCVYPQVHMAGDSCHGEILCGWCIHYSQ